MSLEHIRMISDGSFYTENWIISAEFSFAIIEIKQETSYLVKTIILMLCVCIYYICHMTCISMFVRNMVIIKLLNVVSQGAWF